MRGGRGEEGGGCVGYVMCVCIALRRRCGVLRLERSQYGGRVTQMVVSVLRCSMTDCWYLIHFRIHLGAHYSSRHPLCKSLDSRPAFRRSKPHYLRRHWRGGGGWAMTFVITSRLSVSKRSEQLWCGNTRGPTTAPLELICYARCISSSPSGVCILSYTGIRVGWHPCSDRSIILRHRLTWTWLPSHNS